MKISSIKTQTQKPIFSANINKTNMYAGIYKSKINSIPDTFTKSNDSTFVQNQIEVLINKFKKQTNFISPKDIYLQAQKISKNLNIPIDRVLEFMNTITQFSSYKCIPALEKELKNNGFYFTHNLNFLDNNEDFSQQPFLHFVLKYILIKNTDNTYKDAEYNSSIILDSELLKKIAQLPSKDLKKFKKEIKKNENKLLFIPNFENGYNFLNQNESLETFTTKLLTEYKQKYGDNFTNFSNKINTFLNEENNDLIKKLKLDVKYITPKLNTDYSTESIANQTNSILPTADEIMEIINNKSLSINNKEDYKKYILDFINNMTVVLSPKEYSDKMKILHNKIIKTVQELGKDTDKIFYAVPNTNKSFIAATYEYKNANKLDKINTIYPCKSPWGELLDYFDFTKLPEDSTIVLLDDCAITGSSLIHQQFNYANFLYQKNIKNLSIIMAPLTITQKGKKNIEHTISGNDKLVTAQTLPDWELKNIDIETEYLYTTPNTRYITSLILPYMGPDTNCAGLIPFYNKFFINSSAQKAPIYELDFQLQMF